MHLFPFPFYHDGGFQGDSRNTTTIKHVLNQVFLLVPKYCVNYRYSVRVLSVLFFSPTDLCTVAFLLVRPFRCGFYVVHSYTL